MTVKSRTVDNLGPEVSARYAQDQKLYDKRLVEESRVIPQKAEAFVAVPAAPASDFEKKYSLARTFSFAFFSPPNTGLISEGMLFSYQLIPNLGGTEKMEANQEKLQRLGDTLRPQNKEAKEQRIILALLVCISHFNKTLALLNSKRNQYQRG